MPQPAQGPNSQEADMPRSAQGSNFQEAVTPQPAWGSETLIQRHLALRLQQYWVG